MVSGFRVQAAIQELAKQAQNKNEMDSIEKLTSIERMRCSCTVPRDPSNLYKEMDKAGLSYGPSFRLLTEVFIPGVSNEGSSRMCHFPAARSCAQAEIGVSNASACRGSFGRARPGLNVELGEPRNACASAGGRGG